jgi:hypothetical protein
LASNNRKLNFLELFSLIVVISLIVGVNLYIFGISKRLSALESEVVEVKTWAFPASLLEGKYASLNARVRALSDAFSGLDAKLVSVAAQQRLATVAAEAAVEGTMPVTEADIPSEAPAAGIARPQADGAPGSAEATGMVRRADEETPAAVSTPVESQPVTVLNEAAGDTTVALDPVEETPVEASQGETALPVTSALATDAGLPQGNGKEGPWVINLLSDPNEAAVGRFAARARDRGVPVEQNRAEVNGRVFWRVQLTGFATAKQAQTHAEEVKEKLHLKDVWIFKQEG